MLPRPDPFFQDLVGDQRGSELMDVATGEYVAHKGDLWCYRAKFTMEGYIFPGQINDGEFDPETEMDIYDPGNVSVTIDQEKNSETELSRIAENNIADISADFDINEPMEEPTEVESFHEVFKKLFFNKIKLKI